MTELKQFSGLVESQINATIATFDRLKKVKPTKAAMAARTKAWKDFHDKWIKLDTQMAESFVKWTPESLKSDYFYGPLFQRIKDAAGNAGKLHQMHDAYFKTANGSPELKTMELQIGEASASSQNELNALKSKIEQTEKLPVSPNGLPQREESL